MLKKFGHLPNKGTSYWNFYPNSALTRKIATVMAAMGRIAAAAAQIDPSYLPGCSTVLPFNPR